MESINKMKRQPREQKKILTNEATHKGLIPPNIQTGHAAQYQKKNKQPNEKMGGRPK